MHMGSPAAACLLVRPMMGCKLLLLTLLDYPGLSSNNRLVMHGLAANNKV